MKKVTLFEGDCLEVLPTLAEASYDACITDPPYHLTSISKRFGKEDSAPAQYGRDGAYSRTSRGFMGQTWDGGDVAFCYDTWRLVHDRLKPGAHLLAFGGTRTYHRLVCAIEDAGFEIRDCITWFYGSGFPKSHDAGEGRGTALKPAQELICLARKPLIGTVAENIAAHGTGALNIEACRIESGANTVRSSSGGENGFGGSSTFKIRAMSSREKPQPSGRWPANVIHDGSPKVLALLPESKSSPGIIQHQGYSGLAGGSAFREGPRKSGGHEDQGSAARFFYCAKASPLDRIGTSHPTVKPLQLLGYLARLVTPPNGLILDPFAGSGTTGIAARFEGFQTHLIEREAKYAEEIRWRLDYFAGKADRTLKQSRAERPALRQAVSLPLLEALS